MSEHEASRTLVKSPPELWEECSDAASLARHLGQFGEIRITRLEPESTVAWEGEGVRGTVLLEPSGWGTRVTLTANPEGEVLAEAPLVEGPEPAPADPEPTTLSSAQWAKRARLLGRVTALFRPREAEPAEPAVAEIPEPAITDEASPTPDGAPPDPETEGALAAALDSLGQAHHRPFSRP
jgi:hypothetical protein